jgi:hypothetical protein
MDILNWLFFGPSRLLAVWPYAGFAIAALLIGAQLLRTLANKDNSNIAFNRQWFRKAPVFTGLLWVIFNLYEMQMKAVMPATEAAFSMARLDLIVLTPLLYVLSAFALYSLFATSKR